MSVIFVEFFITFGGSLSHVCGGVDIVTNVDLISPGFSLEFVVLLAEGDHVFERLFAFEVESFSVVSYGVSQSLSIPTSSSLPFVLRVGISWHLVFEIGL